MLSVVITGAARGLGQALAEEIAAPQVNLFLIDKRDLTQTKKNCFAKKAKVFTFNFDLAKTSEINNLCQKIFSIPNFQQAEKFYLINNAAETIPLNLVGKINDNALDYELKTDITAYLLMANEFIRKTQDWEREKKIINISSGAANKVLRGAAAYCASKAAVDMFTKVVGAEQNLKKYPVGIAAVTPGVVDTGMQVDLRSASKENFPEVEKFKVLHAAGLLQSPVKTAAKICKIFTKKKFPNGRVVNYWKI